MKYLFATVVVLAAWGGPLTDASLTSRSEDRVSSRRR